MPQTATTDSQISDLQRQLASSRQDCTRLERELDSMRSQLERAQQAAAAAEKRARERPTPAPAPAPPPPAPRSPGADVAKAAAAAANARAERAEGDVRDARASADKLRKEIVRLEAELARKPAAAPVQNEENAATDRNAAALQRVRFDLEKTKKDLDDERERRQRGERLLEEAKRHLSNGGAPSGGGMRQPEAAVPKRGYTDSDREYDEAREAERRRLIKALDGRLGELEERKLSHEQMLQKELNAANSKISTLQAQLNRLPLAMLNKTGSAASSPRAPPEDRYGGGGAALRHKQRAASKPPALTAHARPASPRSTTGVVAVRDRTALTEDERQMRLKEIDPAAAAALSERKSDMEKLRLRLTTAQAQQAAELTAANYGGRPFSPPTTDALSGGYAARSPVDAS